MRIFFQMMMALGLLMALGCSKASAPVSADGVYSFDAGKFLQNLNQSEDPVFKNMPKEVLDKTVAGLKTFTIEIKGNEAAANFADVVVKGSLKKVDSTDGLVRFLMTPTDEDKKNDTATLIIDGKNLTLDPGKDKADQLFFSKM